MAAAISSKEALLVLSPLLAIGKSLNTEEFQKQVEPVVVQLFANPDRALRVTLLQLLEGFVKYLSPSLTAETIYPQVLQGLNFTVITLILTLIGGRSGLQRRGSYVTGAQRQSLSTP